MLHLSVNVNKIATLRNSRGGNIPNLRQTALDILNFGAHGITVHPRPDGRHIRTDDVHELSDLVNDWNKSHSHQIEFNIEGYPDPQYLKLLQSVDFHQATLVPDPPEVLTSNAGWKLAKNKNFLREVTSQIKSMGGRVSLFVDVFTWNETEGQALAEIGADRIELFTEAYARAFNSKECNEILLKYKSVGEATLALGLGVNAGHDLNHENLGLFAKTLPFVSEVSIGHALISQSLYWGLEKTIKTYLKVLA